MAFYLTTTHKNTMLDALATNFNTGYLRIYSGSVPASADAVLGAAVLLAELRFSATAFPAASSGTLTANAITQDTAADATGTASFYRAFKSDGTTVVSQGACATSGAELNLVSTAIQANAPVQVTALTISI